MSFEVEAQEKDPNRVLDGAEALAVPTRFGQNLVVKEGKSDFLKWYILGLFVNCTL
jgi:hypothetical protein